MENNFDITRLHYLERKDKLMVIDRITGRWMMFSQSVGSILPLVGTPVGIIEEPHVQNMVTELTKLLTDHGIGIRSPKKNNGLNTVILKLTKACNLACTYCYDFEPEDRARHMDKEIALKAIYQAIDLCAGQVNFILHGGEPMLVWSLIEDLVLAGEAYGKTRNVKVAFTGQTNLTRLDAEKVYFSARHHVQWGISFDGPKELHDAFRVKHNGREGSYDTIVQAIREFPAFVKKCNALSTITKVNQGRLVDIANHTYDLGFAGWDWSLFQAIGRGRESSTFDCDIDILIEAWDKLFIEVEQGHFMGFPIKPVLKYLNNFVDGPIDNMCMRSHCGAGRDLLSVSYDGTIEACDCIDPCSTIAKIGNMRAGGLNEAITSAKADIIRSRDVETLQCGTCRWQGVCGGTCMARAGGINEISDHECRLSLFAFDRISNSIAGSNALLEYKKSCEY
ncbi:MAG: radical SAM protein [Chitinophagaceae bacterium]